MKYKYLSLVSVLAFVAVALALTACNKRSAETKPADVDYYTCTMHPSVKSQDPNGKCPICSMDLVPVMKGTGGESKPSASPHMQEKKSGEMQGMAGKPGLKNGSGKKRAPTKKFALPAGSP